MSMPIQIRPMTQNAIDLIYLGLSGHDISKPRDYVERCWEENQSKERVTLLAFYESEFVGWGHVVYKSKYPYFVETEYLKFKTLTSFHHLGNVV